MLRCMDVFVSHGRSDEAWIRRELLKRIKDAELYGVNGPTLFEVATRPGFRVRVPVVRWELIVTTKHPAMRGRGEDVRGALGDPDEIRHGRWICAVARRVDDRDGFLITAYPTDAIKEGTRVWTK
jgi:hypothetical protein